MSYSYIKYLHIISLLKSTVSCVWNKNVSHHSLKPMLHLWDVQYQICEQITFETGESVGW